MTRVRYVVAQGKSTLEDVWVDVDTERHAVIPATASNNEPDISFTLTPALAQDVRSGVLTIGVGFMRGSIKMSGDNAKLLAALATLDRVSGL